MVIYVNCDCKSIYITAMVSHFHSLQSMCSKDASIGLVIIMAYFWLLKFGSCLRLHFCMQSLSQAWASEQHLTFTSVAGNQNVIDNKNPRRITCNHIPDCRFNGCLGDCNLITAIRTAIFARDVNEGGGAQHVEQAVWDTRTCIHGTARCRYNAVNFLENSHNRHPISRPLGWDMACLL